MIISNNKTGYRYKMCAAGADQPTDGPPIYQRRIHLGVLHTKLDDYLASVSFEMKPY